MIAYELPDDCGPALADLRRDPPRTPPALVTRGHNGRIISAL